MSKPWGGAGAWAAEAERAEAEEREQAAALAAVAPAASFPSLKEGVKQQPKKKKMTRSEFYAAGGSKDSGGAKGLTPDEMMRLPTGPKERSAEEMQYGRLGGGFSSYGGGGGGAGRREADREGSWGGSRRSYGGGYDEDRRGGGPMQARVSEFEPSRADGVDDWGAGKKPFVFGDAAARPSRGAFFSGHGGGRDGVGGDASRVDDVDNWAAGKRAAAPAAPVRSSTFGSVGFGFSDSGPDSGRWSRGGASFHENNGQERARLVLAPRNESNVTNAGASEVTKPSPFGAARPREEVLAEKGLDWKKLDSEIDKGLSRPTSSQSSRPNSAQSSRSENVGLQGGAEAEPRPKVNPFGDAKPREVLLEEKGKDWRKIDMNLERRVDRPETEEEKTLKDEINRLKKELEKGPYPQETGPDAICTKDTITQKERDLDQLARELDDKIRFGQKGVDRPGSGAGRAPGFSDRPPSRTGSVDEPRGAEFLERPRSRGTADVWSRSGNDRRPFQGGRERGFLAHRDTDRARTRDRW
uniref:Eukaryotic translation initiation factor 4B n=1 Tax=Kalanchoe fedtschenkoi TaxID=63787 RepID=A0A7N1A718_KALFE